MTLDPRAVDRLLAAARDTEAPPEIDLDRFEIRAELGRGGMGVVHEAYDRQLGRVVALKLLTRSAGLSEEARARFAREARAAAKLNHPGIAAVFDATPEAIVMQRIEGTNLDAAEPLDTATLASLFQDAALAVHHAHGQGLVHRDLKPANLMLESGPPPRIVVTDFGLAKETQVDAELSATGAVLGTPAFMAPEQARGEPADERSDVYSLGASLYACLAGRPPFVDSDVYRVVRCVAEEDPPPLARAASTDVPKDLATIVAKAMAREPERRYASALELANDLERWRTGRPVHARPPSLAYVARRFLARRRGVVVAAGAAAALVAVVLLPLFLTSRAEERRAERERFVTAQALALADFVGATLLLERTHRDQSRHGQADETLERAIARCRGFLDDHGDVAHVFDFIARLERRRGNDDAARAAFTRALELDPELITARVDRGVVRALRYGDHQARGDLEPEELETLRLEALADLVAVEEAALTPTEFLFALGQREALEGHLEAAEDALLGVIEADDLHLEAYLTLSRLYVAQNRSQEALRMSVRAADLMQGHRGTYRAQRRGGVPSAASPAPAPLAVAGLDELVHDHVALKAEHPSQAVGHAAMGLEHLRDAARHHAASRREAALRSATAAELEFGRAIGIAPSAALHVDVAACRSLRARVLDSAGRRLEGARVRAEATESLERARSLDADEPTLRVASALAARDSAERAATASQARALRTSAIELLSEVAGKLEPQTAEHTHVSTLANAISRAGMDR